MRDCRGNEENYGCNFLNWNGKPDLERWVGNWFEGGKSEIFLASACGDFFCL